MIVFLETFGEIKVKSKEMVTQGVRRMRGTIRTSERALNKLMNVRNMEGNKGLEEMYQGKKEKESWRDKGNMKKQAGPSSAQVEIGL